MINIDLPAKNLKLISKIPMNNIAKKLEYIKWLKSIGIEYYFSTKKDSDISLINELKGHYNKK